MNNKHKAPNYRNISFQQRTVVEMEMLKRKFHLKVILTQWKINSILGLILGTWFHVSTIRYHRL